MPPEIRKVFEHMETVRSALGVQETFDNFLMITE